MNKTTRSINIKILPAILLLVLFTAACGGKDTPTPEATDEFFEDFVPVVSATGIVLPQQRAILAMPSGGMVEELLVEEDQQVEKGDIMLRLSGSDLASAAVSAARLELVSAEQALTDVEEGAAVASAEIQQALADAHDAVRDAERNLTNLSNASDQPDIDQAYANLILARDQLEDAQEEYDKHSNKPEDNVVRATYLSLLAQAENAYEDAERVYNNRISAANDIDINQAKADLAYAEALVDQLTDDFAKVEDGSPHPDTLALAKARLQNAQDQLDAAQTALDDLSLEAPFDGTVSLVYVDQYDWVTPGQPVIALADLSHMLVETTDLNEIDVARIHVGSKATITFDALPDESIEATVIRIAKKSSPGTGVNYTVTLELSSIPEGLLWDMTAFVDIEVEDE